MSDFYRRRAEREKQHAILRARGIEPETQEERVMEPELATAFELADHINELQGEIDRMWAAFLSLREAYMEADLLSPRSRIENLPLIVERKP